jgi:hypothetical protein
MEVARFLIENHRANDVGRQQVRRELNPLKFRADHFGHRTNRQGFGKARDAFQQDVAPGEKPDEQSLDHGLLTYDTPSNLLDDRLGES